MSDRNEKVTEAVDKEKIVLDAAGKYPRLLIIKDQGGFEKQYRLIRTQTGGFILNK